MCEGTVDQLDVDNRRRVVGQGQANKPEGEYCEDGGDRGGELGARHRGETMDNGVPRKGRTVQLT